MTFTTWLKYEHEIKRKDNLSYANLCQLILCQFMSIAEKKKFFKINSVNFMLIL